MKYDLRYFGDPILRQQAKPVEEITDEIREICHNLIETMEAAKGIGLAATQVGLLHRIFVTNLIGEEEDGQLILGDPLVYINPVLTNPSDSLVEANEGCLSIPGLHTAVLRPFSIDVEALDLDGNRFTEQLEGYVARNRMHELDHLNGTLFIDRIKGKRRTALDPVLRKIKQEYYKPKQL